MKPVVSIVFACVVLVPFRASTEPGAAEIAFAGAVDLFEGYVRLKITSVKPRDLKRQLMQKIEGSREVEAAFKKVFDLKDPPWVVAAAYMIGRVHEDLALVLREVPVPGRLTPEQKEIFIEALNARAEPFDQKAIQAYKTAIDQAKTHGIASQHAEKAMQRLGAILAEQEARAQKRGPSGKAPQNSTGSAAGGAKR